MSDPEVTLYTRDEVNEILSEGYPTEEQLAKFPLGKELIAIPDVNDRYSKHIPKVIEGVNILLSDRPFDIVKKWKDESDPIEQNTFVQTINKINVRDKSEGYCKFEPETFKSFFRILGVYHDIGKRIIHERHPLVGWHLLKDVWDDRVKTGSITYALSNNTQGNNQETVA